MLHCAPEFVNHGRLEEFDNWLWESIESDLLANKIDGAEAERRGKLGALWTAHLSDLVITTKVVEAGTNNLRGKSNTDLVAIKSTYRAETGGQAERSYAKSIPLKTQSLSKSVSAARFAGS